MSLQAAQGIQAAPGNIHRNGIRYRLRLLGRLEASGGQRPGKGRTALGLNADHLRHFVGESQGHQIFKTLVHPGKNHTVTGRDIHQIRHRRPELTEDFQRHRLLPLYGEGIMAGIPRKTPMFGNIGE